VLAAAPEAMNDGKIVSAAEACGLIQSGDTVATGGFVGIGFAEEVAIALEALHLSGAPGGPRTCTWSTPPARATAATAASTTSPIPGLVPACGRRPLGPGAQAAEARGRQLIEAWNLPQGVIAHLYRDIAAGKPGHLSRIGSAPSSIRATAAAGSTRSSVDDLVTLMPIDGREYLFYKAFPIDVAIVRGTTADADGNVTMEREALTLESLSMAMAARNSGGLVIVQVERIAERGTLNARQSRFPGILVDCVVVADPANHRQTFATAYNAAYSGEHRCPRARTGRSRWACAR
jgi:propionate CoA-transferase